MPHPLVLQLRFTRSEFKRGLQGLTDSDARQRLMPMNCISWNIGHLAWQEQRYWLTRMRGETPYPMLNEQFAFGAPACTPALDEMWTLWTTITTAADPFLDTLTTEQLQAPLVIDGKQMDFGAGSMMLRMTYHYWYHTGENLAIRQMLGHTKLPDFVGDIETEAPYQPH